MENKYFLLRHGQTPYQTPEKQGLHYPCPESENEPVLLTEKGKEQIKKVAQKLESEDIDLIFSSDINRAQQTAEIVARKLDLEVEFDLRLRDINYGVYHGGPRKEFYRKYPDTMKRFESAPPKGESWGDCRKRIKDFLEQLEQKYQGKKILIIGHGDPLWLLQGLLENQTDQELLQEKLAGKVIKVGELRVYGV